METKESRSSNTHIRQNRLNKGCEKRQRRTLHNDQRINPSRRYNNLNTYAPNIGVPQYVRQMLTSMKGEINSSTIIVGDFNIQLTPMDKSTKQKISKETQTLNATIELLDLIDNYKTFHPKTMNFYFVSNAHGTFSRIDHILGNKYSLGKFKKIKIISSIFSDHNA